jgi:hypothetical protein
MSTAELASQNTVTKSYEYIYTNPKTGKTKVKKVNRKYQINPKPKSPHMLEPNEVKKEYDYNGHKITRYYKVKNVERNLPGSSQAAGIQQITEQQTNS